MPKRRSNMLAMYGPVIATIELRASGDAFLKMRLPLPKMNLQKLIEDGQGELAKAASRIVHADRQTAHVHV